MEGERHGGVTEEGEDTWSLYSCISELFCVVDLESGQDMAKASSARIRSEMGVTNQEGENRRPGDRPAAQLNGSSLDRNRAWQKMAPCSSSPSTVA